MGIQLAQLLCKRRRMLLSRINACMRSLFQLRNNAPGVSGILLQLITIVTNIRRMDFRLFARIARSIEILLHGLGIMWWLIQITHIMHRSLRPSRAGVRSGGLSVSPMIPLIIPWRGFYLKSGAEKEVLESPCLYAVLV